MKYEFVTNIIQFKDGSFFNGVKGKLVRKTQFFKDAKMIDDKGLSDRDKRYLKNYDYELIKVKFTIESIEE